MSDDANTLAAGHDYVTDVPYLRTFSNDLSPASLRCAAALNGFAPPPAHDFDYLELGCGNGDTLITLAAAYPQGRFVGIDLNASHIAFARELADRVHVDNVRFLHGDFEDLPQGDLQGLDYVTMWGLLSWISPHKRKAAIELAGARLKDGGIVFASYNTMPGWSAVEPFRRLMLDSAGTEGGSLDRAHRGLSVAKLLSDAGAQYFANNPAAKKMVATSIENGLPYVVHEYFHADWHPMYFEDLAREMAASGIYFVGQMPLFCNYRDLVIPASLLPLFNGVTDRVAFERLKDYAINEFFRRDVYMKGGRTRSDDTTRSFLDATQFGTLMDADQVKRRVQLPNYSLDYVGPIFEMLIPALAEQAQSVAELAKSPALASYGHKQIRDAVLHLALGEQVVPMQQPVARSKPLTQGSFRATTEHNRTVLEQPLTHGALVVLACPATGTGVVLSAVQVVCIRALGVQPSHREQWLRALVDAHPMKLHAEGRAVEETEAQVKMLAYEVGLFAEKRLPKLIQLGLLEQTPE
ncbi:MAG: methyltransferase regulatory domain-containing protein [Deltaproteobacteria bacterium]|nr:methyltransferase regulatory domain-containing protein [Deltaproteobacteria bacterium]